MLRRPRRRPCRRRPRGSGRETSTPTSLVNIVFPIRDTKMHERDCNSTCLQLLLMLFFFLLLLVDAATLADPAAFVFFPFAPVGFTSVIDPLRFLRLFSFHRMRARARAIVPWFRSGDGGGPQCGRGRGRARGHSHGRRQPRVRPLAPPSRPSTPGAARCPSRGRTEH